MAKTTYQGDLKTRLTQYIMEKILPLQEDLKKPVEKNVKKGKKGKNDKKGKNSKKKEKKVEPKFIFELSTEDFDVSSTISFEEEIKSVLSTLFSEFSTQIMWGNTVVVSIPSKSIKKAQISS